MRVVLSSLLVAAIAASSQAADLDLTFNPFGTPTTGSNPVGILVSFDELDADEKITVQNTTFTAINSGDLQNLEGVPLSCFSGTPGPAIQREKEADCADVNGVAKSDDSWWGDYLTVHLGADGLTGGGTADNSMGLNFGTGPFGDDEFDDPDNQGEAPFPSNPTTLFYGVIPDRFGESGGVQNGIAYHIELAISDGTAGDPDARIETFEGFLRCLLGDMDLDGDVDLDDVDPFVLALTDAAEYETQYGFPSDYKGDIDSDGDNDLDDVDPFVCVLTTGDPVCGQGGGSGSSSLAGGGGTAGVSAVPEPSMFVLALLGFVGLVGSQTFSRSRR